MSHNTFLDLSIKSSKHWVELEHLDTMGGSFCLLMTTSLRFLSNMVFPRGCFESDFTLYISFHLDTFVDKVFLVIFIPTILRILKRRSSFNGCLYNVKKTKNKKKPNRAKSFLELIAKTNKKKTQIFSGSKHMGKLILIPSGCLTF